MLKQLPQFLIVAGTIFCFVNTSVGDEPPGFKSLFNGKDLSGWEGQTERHFSVKDGIIVAKNSKKNSAV